MKKFLLGFVYAFRGLGLAWWQERNMKVHSLAAVVVIGMGVYFQITPGEWCAVCLAMGLVLGLELMNTAIEHLVNLVSPERHPQAGKIKDIAAAAVLIAAMAALVVGLVVFVPYLL